MMTQAYVGAPNTDAAVAAATAARSAAASSPDALGLVTMVRAFRAHGHDAAQLDPLGLYQWREHISSVVENPLLDPKQHGFMESAMDKQMDLTGTEKVTVDGFSRSGRP